MNASAYTSRIASLDQFRGYTVLGMFLVNFVGGYHACHYLLKHHNTFCSYADTIMPQFLFAVGFAFRLTFDYRVETQGLGAASYRVVRRLLGLLLVSLVVYTVDRGAASWNELVQMGFWQTIKTPLKREWFQTLTHIAVTSLWILPVIRAGVATRLAFMTASAAAHVALSYWFYFEWVNTPPNGIDGGPLGFLTWTIPAIIGSLACDVVIDDEYQKPVFFPLVFWGLLLMALGYFISCGTRLYDVTEDEPKSPNAEKLAADPVLPSRQAIEEANQALRDGDWQSVLAEPPFVPPPHPDGDIGQNHQFRRWNYWMMSQRAGTLSYLTFSAGFSLALYAVFYLFCDVLGWELGVFRTFGTNAIVGYVLHMMVDSAVGPFVPRDSPAWYMWTACAIFMLITYSFVRSLEKQQIYIRL